MSRVEQTGKATLYLGDCRDILPTLGKVDAVVTDPPYGVGFKYASHDDTPVGYIEWCAEWFALLNADVAAISCGIANMCDWPRPNWALCWHKPGAMGRCSVGFNNWEPVLIYGKTQGKQGADVFQASLIPDRDLVGHPCPKPLQWGVKVIDRIASKASSILDPFLGSGTTGVAAVMAGKQFIGIEKEEAYFDIACKRIEDAQRQGSLFGEAA